MIDSVDTRRLLDDAPSFVALLTGPAHTFTYVNRSYLTLIDQRDVIGKTVRQAMPELAAQGYFERLDEVYRTGKAFAGTSLPVMLQRDGASQLAEHYLDFVYQPLLNEAGEVTGILAQGHDVTDRECARRQYRELLMQGREARRGMGRLTTQLHRAQRVAQIGSWEYSRYGTVCSPEVYRIFGLVKARSAEGFGTYMSFVHPEDRERVRVDVVLAVKGQRRLNCEHRIVRADGEIRHVHQRAVLLSGDQAGFRALSGTIQDITESKEAKSKLDGNEALAQMAARVAGLGGWSVKVGGLTVEWSDQVCLIHEVPPGTVPSVDQAIAFYTTEWRSAMSDAFKRCIRAGAPFDLELEIVTAKGHRRWVRSLGQAARDRSGAVVRVQGAFQDITERKRAEAALHENQRSLAHLAHHDALTGLRNRLYLKSAFPELLHRAVKSKETVALIYIDIDHFKNINDSRGHTAGDSLLLVIAERLRRAVGAKDLLARMGGDEFAVVVSVDDDKDVESIVSRLIETLAVPIEIDGSVLSVTSSVGVSLFPTDGNDIDVLLQRADIALYRAKEQGRNGYALFAPEMDTRLNERLALEQALRRAIGTPEFFIEYQPIVDIASNKLVAFEALLRWRQQKFGLIPPARFIKIAEESAAILELGDWVLRRVCQQIDSWARNGGTVVPVCVNISPKQLERSPLPQTVTDLMKEFNLERGLLSFEITEGAVVQHIEKNLGTLHSLRRIGSRIAVDDFGTGYSSLSYLKHLPIDTLKIDRAFIRDMCSNDSDAAIVAAIVAMARALQLRTVAEGVETAEQVEHLRELGCDSAQGYYLGRPMSPELCQPLLMGSNDGSVTSIVRMRSPRVLARVK